MFRLRRFQDAQALADAVHDSGLAELVLLGAAGERPCGGADTGDATVGYIARRGRVGSGKAGGDEAEPQAALLLCGMWGAIDVPERAAAFEWGAAGWLRGGFGGKCVFAGGCEDEGEGECGRGEGGVEGVDPTVGRGRGHAGVLVCGYIVVVVLAAGCGRVVL